MTGRSGLRIGRLFGINIRIDWSWLFIFVLVTWNLSVAFGQMHPNWQISMRWIVAGIAALLFFGSVLAHEMAHSLVAIARGVPVRNITLFLFGGVSNIEREPDSPRHEFFMAIVGPLTSIVLGLILMWLAGLTAGDIGGTVSDPMKAAQQMSPATTLLLWLGSINVLLGIFNLIPGFPLDGGRVLRSILWAAMGSLRRATRWASWVGQGIAWLLILAGISMVFGLRIPIFGTGFVGGLWLAFIGWFLNTASVQSYQQVVIRDILEDVPVARMMRADPPVVGPDSSVGSLVHDHVMKSDDYAFPVMEGDRLVGLVTLEDVRSIERDRWDNARVQEIMTPAGELVTVEPATDAAEAFRKLVQRDVRQLPVLEDGRLVGLLRRRDIVKWLQIQSELE